MKTAKTKPPKSVSRFTLHESASASALIIAVVLTSLLAIIGVMFVMIARVDKMATSAISENKELNFAVETVVAKISQELVLDVPGMPKGREYYDYPGEEDKWLASLEPYEKTAGNYYWRQISDVYNKLPSSELIAEIIPDYQDSVDVNTPADADGDGVADSNWVIIPDMTSSKGKPIYAAIRIVDNGGMINVNTAYKFDPNVGSVNANLIDGSSQTQINLLALSERGSTSNPLGELDDARFGSEPLPHVLDNYIEDVVWRYNEPNGLYTPFDISDELKLRNRYILNYNLMTSRIEGLWKKVYDWGLYDPRTDPVKFAEDSENGRNYWFFRTYNGSTDPNIYDYRHISTTCNMDRIIRPNGDKMVNINDPNVSIGSLYSAIRAGLYDADPNFAGVNGVAAQIAVNLKDYIDSDSDVTPFAPDVNSPTYYGFERPCVYISELAYRFVKLTIGAPIDTLFRKSYAIELYKPYPEDNYPEPNQWRLNIQGYRTVDVNWSGTKHFHVIYLEDSCAPLLPVIFDSGDSDPDFPLRPYVQTIPIGYNTTITSVSLERFINANWIPVDSIDVPPWLTPAPPSAGSIIPLQSRQRDITLHKCIRRLWAPPPAGTPDLGFVNAYVDNADTLLIQAHPANSDFNNVGEIGMLFRKSAYSQGPNPIEPNDTEATARLNLADPNFQQFFEYLTVFDPNSDTIDNDGDGLIDALDTNTPEYKVAGRININTAPWYVIAQLPWVGLELAQAIVAYRDKLKLNNNVGYHTDIWGNGKTRKQGMGLKLTDPDVREVPGFASIDELLNVTQQVLATMANEPLYDIRRYGRDTKDQQGFPDLTTDPVTKVDGAADDFEERDVIFARISNLVTVRSDVFTAYILVRIGADGPQKRVMAILDRSNVYSPTDKVRVVALHPVPDPR